jgi:hypothetical protein
MIVQPWGLRIDAADATRSTPEPRRGLIRRAICHGDERPLFAASRLADGCAQHDRYQGMPSPALLRDPFALRGITRPRDCAGAAEIENAASSDFSEGRARDGWVRSGIRANGGRELWARCDC